MRDGLADIRQWKIFAVLAGLGLVAQLHHVQIPHTDVLIDGRWTFGYLGFALLPRWWAALLLACILSVPWGSNVPFLAGFFGNLSYALPALLVLRPLHRIMLARRQSGWIHGLGWFAAVLLCYQAFTTPAVWAVLAMLQDVPVPAKVLAGWQLQPFLVESILVAAFSATAMVAYLAHARLQESRRRLTHLNHVLLGIRNVNQLIVTEDDPRRLIERSCVNLTATMGYLNAWIALLDKKQRIVGTAAAGFDDGFATLQEELGRGVFPDCMQRALDADATIVVADPPGQCRHCPVAKSYGGRAGFCRRLRHGEKTYGVLTVSVPADHATDEQEQTLFAEVAGDLAFAMHRIEAARLLHESRSMLARTESIASIGSWEWLVAEDRVFWSDELFRIFARDPARGEPSFAEHD